MPKRLTVLLAIGLQGCATVFNGTAQQLLVSSTPAGATVMVDDSVHGVTPMTATLKRSSSHRVAVSLDGYAPESLLVTPSRRSGAVWGNMFLLHPIGMAAGFGVDLLAKGHWLFPEEQLHVRLRHQAAEAAPAPAERTSWQRLPVGSRVRVTPAPAGAAAISGELLGISEDSLTVSTRAGRGARTLAQADIRSVDLSLGPDMARGMAGSIGRGMLWGFGIGAVTGAIIGGGEGAYYISLLYGAPLGGIGGWLAALAAPRHDRWLRVYDGSAVERR